MWRVWILNPKFDWFDAMTQTHDSSHPDFWNSRYTSGPIPWDYGDVPAELTAYLKRTPGNGRLALVPGCGSGYEVEALLRARWDVYGVDFAPKAVERAQKRLGKDANRILLADFFTYPFGAQYDLIYERTFLCALQPERWTQYAKKIRNLLKPGGVLCGYFYFGDKQTGPPFPLPPGKLEELFAGKFRMLEDSPAGEPLPLFAERERWQLWEAI
jgi:SAM-dependent methyltransferase